MASTVRARILRGVYVKGVAYPDGAIIEVDGNTFAELKAYHYAIEAPLPKPAPQSVTVGIGSVSATSESGKVKAGRG